ncbi:MAG: ArgE/DapE family deacylase [Anaerolineales bacterium]
MNQKLKQVVGNHIDEIREEIIELCSKMVKIPSENPPGDMSEIATFLQGYLEDQGLTVKKFEPEKGRISLVSEIGNHKGPSLILNGHMDVVPVGDKERWDFPPFSGERRDGKILGRGSTDMKGGLTSLITACIAMHRCIDEIPGSIILTMVPDEETGGEHGTSWLIDRGEVKGEACIVGEPGSLDKTYVGEKGACWLKLSTNGVPAHGSLPILGENAIEKLAPAIPLIQEIEHEKVDVPASIQKIIQFSKEFFMDTAKGKMGSDHNVGDVLDHHTVNIGVVSGGSKINMVPESCTAEVDIRIPPGGSSKEVEDQILELLAKENLDVRCERMMASDPNYTRPSERIYSLLAQNVKQVTGSDLQPLFATGFTDGRFFRLSGIPTLNYGPGDVSYIHGFNEYIKAKDIITATKVISNTIIDYLFLEE